MPDLIIESLRGGQNSSDPPIALAEDQAVLMENVEIIESMLGERRGGTTAISLPASITSSDAVPFVFRHLPSSDESASELWVMGLTGTSTIAIEKKTTSWTSVTVSDTPTKTGKYPYQWQAKTLHGKLFLAYKSNVDRLHVWDGTSMRRAGLSAPSAAPTAADSGGAGSLTGDRYYRVRETVKSGSTTLRRSEPSAVLTHSPSGTNASITVTKPADMGENATHWELEASLDNINFYILATTAVGTATYVDSTALNTGYDNGTLSEDIEDYATIPSPRYLAVDEDRLIWAGSYEQAALASRVGWTPVYGASGVGNDERFETDIDPFLDLDTYENGEITGLSDTVLGAIWVFKRDAIYKMVRSGKRTAAYRAIKYSDAIGAIDGSVVTGVDSTGSPCVYFIDNEQGPCRIGIGGIKRCGEDVRDVWSTINQDATKVAVSSLFYHRDRQLIWNLSLNSDNTPTKSIVLHVDKSREFEDGVRKGWTTWTGNRAKALSMTIYSSNIDDNAARNSTLVPFIGLTALGHVHRCDTGYQDNGVAYAATITTKPYILKSLVKQFRVFSSTILAKVVASSQITIKCIRNFGLETTATISGVSLAGSGGSETQTIVKQDNFKGVEMRTAQFQFVDVASPAANWQLNQFVLRVESGQED